MLLCRAPRLLTASLDPLLKSPGSFVLLRVKANRAGDVTLTLRKGHTLQRYRCLCASAGGSPTPARPDHQQQQQQQQQQQEHRHNRDSPAFITADWGHMNRVATIAASLSGSASRVPAAGGALFTSSWKMSTGAGSGATQPTRAASSTAAGKKHVDEEPRDKQDEQNPKEAPTDSSSTTGVPAGPEPDGEKPNKTQQLKKVFKEYGAVGVSFHIGMSLMSLGMFYLLVSSGIDMAAVLCKLGFSEAIIQSKMAAGTSTFVLAYAVHKLFAPVRISITLVSVPLIVRYFRKTGLFKPPTPAP